MVSNPALLCNTNSFVSFDKGKTDPTKPMVVCSTSADGFLIDLLNIFYYIIKAIISKFKNHCDSAVSHLTAGHH
jgi:hypothetical protein